jgi:hypothetical protein
MGELAKKVGSLALAVGALALVLVNAGLNHGCAGSQPAANAQAEPGRDDLRPPNPDAGPGRAKPTAPTADTEPSHPDVNGGGLGLAGDDCGSSYMPATKAPIFRMDKCRPGGKSAKPGGKRAVIPSNAPQQAR